MKTSGGQKYKEFTFPDGYTYRQFADGDILIVASPHGGAGTLVTKDGPTATAWQAITDQIRAKKSGNVQAAAATTLQVAQILTATLTPHQKRRRQIPALPPPPPPGPSIPWVPIGIVAAGAALLLALGRSR